MCIRDRGIGWQENEFVKNILDSSFHHIVGTINGNELKFIINNDKIERIK